MARFEDDGFKIYLTLFMWPKADFKKALRAAVKEARVDRSAPEMHEEVARFLVSYPLDDGWLASITTLDWHDTSALSAAVPGWDGESAPYLVRDWSGLLLLDNLEELQWPDSGEVPADALPDHPNLKRVKLPTDYYGAKGMKKNTPAFDALIARGFTIESQEKFGTTVLVRS